ncbi:MAG: threonine ammonia-lyase [Actinomycetota bacterium]
MELVSIDQIERAHSLLADVAQRTPLEYSQALSTICGGPVYLKCENLQLTGAFKIRGAYNRLHGLSAGDRQRGVVAASAGNHAQGVALAANMLGIEATVFMPAGAALPKVEATRAYGAEVVLRGADYNEAFDAASEFVAATEKIMVHPFDHADIIAGQGTVALQVFEQLPEAATLVVPVGGGGLISGIAAAAKGRSEEIRVVGVEPVGAAALSKSVEAGHLVQLTEVSTVADGLAAKAPGELTLAHVTRLVDQLVTVTDDEIAQGLLLMLERAKLIVEPSGAAGVAALFGGLADLRFPVVVVLSGGNIDPMLLLRIIRYGMSSSGRYMSFRTRISDRPGELARLLGVLASAGGNVVGVEHHREGGLMHLGEVEVALQVETRGLDHVKELESTVKEAGYAIDRL